MKWNKVATLRFQAGTTFGFTSGSTRPRFQNVAIFLGPHRTLKCGCKRTYRYLPDEVDIPKDVDVCSHLRALYGNGSYEIDQGGLGRGVVNFGKVYLTDLGREMFSWRYVAKALE